MPVPMIAYCGPAAIPGDVWTRWNFDPWLIAMLLFLAAALTRARAPHRRAGWSAIAVMAVVFVSPLCALSSALFSARVLHHVLLVAVAAPLLAMAFPSTKASRLPLAAVVAAHAVILWLWHTPGAYTWGLASVAAYWLMQVTLLASAWVMWRAILAPSTPIGSALVALGATIGQMGLLGAVIVFAPRPLYLVHFASTYAWGLDPMSDQQLAGLLMWVPAVVPYLIAGLSIAASGLRPRESGV
ncbi:MULTISPECIES: cytochrome c oxidase assembly protein [unclassified Lysobacter]|uniref:cytochrome c oxidase assembly protein n=1 Tax=unclassified Lysobacter TaxID=2635362 RepID=UPI001C23E862|nr:cytochrome c oxidase assembly protein [Lysobacter sp. MMG2]MBU8975865.1 cytochrome c oxidase assembly protein [Lysobacter sp. MMG2]